MTQTGKTGCMTSFIYTYLKNNLIPIENIFIITGLSDIEWKKDTKNRIPESINKQVFHRANLTKKFLKEISEKRNCLIIMDEIQIACEENQTIHKSFEKAGFYNLKFLMKNDIKLIQFSATPDGHINDIGDWEKYSSRVRLLPGVNHYGPKQAIEQKRVKQYKNLVDEKNVIELKKVIEKKYKKPKYHLIRVPSKRENRDGTNNQQIVISNIELIFGKNYEYNENYLKTKKGDINDILQKKPKNHTFVFYCEILRCAKTQIKKHIGVSYERYSKFINDSTIIQGSFGRLTGYDDNGKSICYTNIPSLNNYVKLWDNDMLFKEGIAWNSKTTKFVPEKNKTYSTGTYNSVKHIDELKGNCSMETAKDRGEPIIKKFIGENSQSEMLDWFNEHIKPLDSKITGPKIKKKNVHGFYKAAIRQGLEVLSTDKVYSERKAGFKDGLSYRSYPCYLNTKNNYTLQWWLIYYLE